MGLCKTKKLKDMHEVQLKFPEGCEHLRKNPFNAGGMDIFWNYTSSSWISTLKVVLVYILNNTEFSLILCLLYFLFKDYFFIENCSQTSLLMRASKGEGGGGGENVSLILRKFLFFLLVPY